MPGQRKSGWGMLTPHGGPAVGTQGMVVVPGPTQGCLWWGQALECLGPSIRGGLGSAWASGSSLCPAAATGVSSIKRLLTVLPLRRPPH